MVKELQSKAEFDAVIRGPQLVVVDFHATWCGPCKMIAPFVEDLSQRYPEVVFAKVDGDAVPDVIRAMGVRAFPTFKFFVGGQQVDEMKGADKNKLESLVQTHKTAGGFGSSFSTLAGGSQAPAWDGVGVPPGPGAAMDRESARTARAKMLETVEKQQNKFAAKVAPPAAPTPASTKPAAATPMEVDDDDDALLAQALAMSKNEAASAPAGSTATADATDFDEDTGEPLVPIPVNVSLLSELLDMGFADARARKAIHHGQSLEKALEWLDAHQDDADIDQPYLVREGEARREEARLNAKPLSEEEKAAKMEELKVKIAKRKAERTEQEKKEELVREKARREGGQKMNDMVEDRERLLRRREAERQKKEKDDAARERARLKAEIARDRELRRANGGMLPSVLGVDGYNPSAAQLGAKGEAGEAGAGGTAVSTPVASTSKPVAVAPIATPNPRVSPGGPVPSDEINSDAVTAELLDKMDQLIQTISRYRVGGDGGAALKLLNTFLNNVATSPAELKFRSINAESNAFKSKFLPLVGPVQLLKLVGFVKSPSEEKYILESANVRLLQITCTKLQAAMKVYAEQNPS